MYAAGISHAATTKWHGLGRWSARAGQQLISTHHCIACVAASPGSHFQKYRPSLPSGGIEFCGTCNTWVSILIPLYARRVKVVTHTHTHKRQETETTHHTTEESKTTHKHIHAQRYVVCCCTSGCCIGSAFYTLMRLITNNIFLLLFLIQQTGELTFIEMQQ